MDRALDRDALREALGEVPGLPTPDDLADLVARIEVSLFAQREFDLPDELVQAAWYLHAIASADEALEIYGIERQRSAFQISAHVFELCLRGQRFDPSEKLEFLFAAQIGFFRGGLLPNAVAVQNLAPVESPTESVSIVPGEHALHVATLFLSARLQEAEREARRALNGLRSLSRAKTDRDLLRTAFAPVAGVCRAVIELVQFSRYGRGLDDANAVLVAAVTEPSGEGDLTSRWVAAHLARLGGQLAGLSPWNLLSPNMPNGAIRAFTMVQPAVQAFWPPQAEALSSSEGGGILDPSIRRAVLSMPTSAGKSLVAQVLAAHQIVNGLGDVCYVAPTRSLCREVRSVLESRLRFIERATSGDEDNEGGTASVMTPEALYFALRQDPAGVLQKYKLFVFDEAHTVGDEGRGWHLEACISFIHRATVNQDHKLVFISPALGNLAQFSGWVSADTSVGLTHRSEWRGPRRLHGLYYSHVDDWNSPSRSFQRRSTTSPTGRAFPLTGMIALRAGQAGRYASLAFTEPVGELVVLYDENGRSNGKDNTTSTTLRDQQLPLIGHLGLFGSVLVIVGDRKTAASYASAIASISTEPEPSLSLISFVADRLGTEHQLVEILKRGVGYHHAGLPEEVQVAIEGALKEGAIRYLVSTTTLTEGVNLPVRSVFIARTGAYLRQGYQTLVHGARMLNAMGRAGRALRETEGWVVLGLTSAPSGQAAEYEPDPDSLAVISALTTEESLSELAKYEDRLRVAEDQVFTAAVDVVDDFLSFVLFVRHASAALEATGGEPVEIDQVLLSTLGWQQLNEADRSRWRRVAGVASDAYDRLDEGERRRWVTSGIRPSLAARVDELAVRLVAAVETIEALEDESALVSALWQSGIINDLLALPGSPSLDVYTTRSHAASVSYSLEELMRDWMAGVGISTLGETHLSQVADLEFRAEQLSDLVAGVFQEYLPRMLGILIDWSAEALTAAHPRTAGELLLALVAETEMPEDVLRLLGPLRKSNSLLPSFVRFGVNSEHALALTIGGITSRALAVRASDAYTTDPDSDGFTLREWLCGQGVNFWRDSLQAQPADLRQLLRFARLRTSTLLADVLNERISHIPLAGAEAPNPEPGQVRLKRVNEGELEGLIVAVRDDLTLAVVPLEYQDDVERILDLKLPLVADLRIQEDGDLELEIQMR